MVYANYGHSSMLLAGLDMTYIKKMEMAKTEQNIHITQSRVQGLYADISVYLLFLTSIIYEDYHIIHFVP